MKNFLIYLAGLATGIVLTVVVAMLIAGSSSSTSDSGLSMFEERGDMMPDTSYKVFQVLDDTHALANAVFDEEYSWYNGMVVMIVGDEGTHFYDEQIIRTTKGKRFYQIGIYKYKTGFKLYKTVPVVALLDINNNHHNERK